MSEIEPIIGSKNFWGVEIRKKGKVNVNRFHKELIPWFHKYKYSFLEKGLTGKQASDGREEKIEWTASRDVDSYFRFNIVVEFIVQRWRGEKAEVIVRYKAYIEKDYKNRFTKYKKTGEFFRKIYERYLIKEKLGKFSGKLHAEANDFIDKTKEVLGLVAK